MLLPPARPLAIAHRAGNAIASLRRAEEAGVDLVEADVWLHRGRLEVRHTRTLGRLPLLWDKWLLEAGWRPRLELSALIDAAGPGTGLMLDLKGVAARLPGMVEQIVHQHAGARPIAVCSRNWALLDAFRDHAKITVIHSVGSEQQLALVAARLTWHDHHAVSIHRRLLNPATLAMLKQRAPTVLTWPVNDDRTLATMRRWGVDGVTSDSLDLLRALVDGRRRPVSGPS